MVPGWFAFIGRPERTETPIIKVKEHTETPQGIWRTLWKPAFLSGIGVPPRGVLYIDPTRGNKMTKRTKKLLSKESNTSVANDAEYGILAASMTLDEIMEPCSMITQMCD